MAYFESAALKQLKREVDALWPGRDKSSDGWVGDTSHQARPSDHNPDYSAGGIVRARDIDEDLVAGLTAVGEAMPLVNAIITDPRVAYVIYEGRIWQNPAVFKNGGWLPYNGVNKHNHHIHVSVRRGSQWDSNGASWNLAGKLSGGGTPTPQPPTPTPEPEPIAPEEDPSTMNRDFIAGLYWTGMRRAPSETDIDSHLLGMVDWVINGMSVADALKRKRDEILMSPEALNFIVKRAYQDLLGRQADPVGLETLVSAMRAGQIPPTFAGASASLQQSQEYKDFWAKPKAERDAAIIEARKAIPAYRTLAP